MRTRLERRVRRARRHALVVDASAEQLPFGDASFDTIVCTFVLCSIESPDRAGAEIARVLRPDGQLLFIEHVRAESPALAYWQDRLLYLWRRFAPLPLQPSDGGADARVRVRGRGARGLLARNATDRPAADHRPGYL
jgi:SAM-dependent methyltransferase